jgi:arsenate reductase-like glutaredoxin family protein
VEDRDLTRTPPSRQFLEEHVDEEHFLDFISRRSPVFKQRPLPKTKREAIEMMLENPNLIKRPIIVKGRKTIFGFDKEAIEGL